MPPSEQPTTAVGPVVVGIDGSEGSLVALRVAADEARRRGATLEVVVVWHPGVVGSLPVFGVGTPVDAQLEELRRGLADTLADEGLADGNPEVRERVVNGHAAEVLVEASGSAALVVVGTRGHGGLAGKMLGSVSQQVVAHARCPVMVVPHSST
jgi:nucleotide-binding universal stress UspA family protein